MRPGLIPKLLPGSIRGWLLNLTSDVQAQINGKAAVGHDHAGVYSPVAHDHAGVYSPVVHDHAGVYVPAANWAAKRLAPLTGAVDTANANPVATNFAIAAARTWLFEVRVTARQNGGPNSAAYVFTGAIKNNGGTTALVGAVATLLAAEDVGGWNCVVTASDADDALVVTVTGALATDIHWDIVVDVFENTGA